MTKIEPAYILGTTQKINFQNEKIEFCISAIKDKSLVAKGIFFSLYVGINQPDAYFKCSYSQKDNAYKFEQEHLRYIKSQNVSIINKEFYDIMNCKQWLDDLIEEWACYHRDLVFNIHDQEDAIKAINNQKIKF